MLDAEEKATRSGLVIDHYDGVVPQFQAFYIESIKYSASRCLIAFGKYGELTKDGNNKEQLVSLVQEAVGHAAALSRYFWPSPGGKLNKLKKYRGIKLRSKFNLTEESALNNREIRNAWEHFDERLDSYMLEFDTGFFFPGCILGSHTLADDPTGHVFKLLDPDAEVLVLMGIKFHFSDIRSEVQQIYAKSRDLVGGQ